MKHHEIQVIEPNALAEARQDMNKPFLNFFHITLHLVSDRLVYEKKDNLEANLEYIFNIRDYSDLYSLTYPKNLYAKLRDDAKHMMASNDAFTIINEEGHEVTYHPFSSIEYIPENFSIKIRLTNEFKDLLVKLLNERGKKIYFLLADTLRMRSVYAKKMYPILLEFVGKPMPFLPDGNLHGKMFDRIDKIEDLRKLLSIPESYVTQSFKAKLNSIATEINKYTPFRAEVYFNHVKGRGRYNEQLTHVCWTIQRKNNVNLNEKRKLDTNKVDSTQTPHELDPDVKRIVELTGLDVNSSSIIANAANKYNRDYNYIVNAYYVAKNENPINLGRLMTYFMTNGYSSEPKSTSKPKNSFHNFHERHYPPEFFAELARKAIRDYEAEKKTTENDS